MEYQQRRLLLRAKLVCKVLLLPLLLALPFVMELLVAARYVHAASVPLLGQ